MCSQHKLSWSGLKPVVKDKVPPPTHTHTQTPLELCQGSHLVCEWISDKVSGHWPLLMLHNGDGHMAALQCFSANTSSLSAGPSQLWMHSLSQEALKYVGYEQCSSAVSFASIIRGLSSENCLKAEVTLCVTMTCACCQHVCVAPGRWKMKGMLTY